MIAGPPAPPAHHFVTRVSHVSDGDTFGGYLTEQGEVRIRIIGIDTPETKDPRTGVECYGRKASKRLTRLIDGKVVTVAFERRRRDDYGRLLLDLWGPSGKFVAAQMVRGGFARTMAIAPNDQHAAYLAGLERTARRQQRGLWGACPAG